MASTFNAERVLKIWHFVWNLRVAVGRKDRVLTMNGLYILPEALPIIIIHFKKVMKHSGSNEWLFSHHVTPFSMLRGCPKFDAFLEVWQLVFYKNDMVWTIMGVCMLSEVSLIIPIRLMMLIVPSISNGCLSLQYSIPFAVLKGCPKFVILLEIWELFLAERTRCWQYEGLVYTTKSSPNQHYTSKEGYDTINQ